MNFLCGMSYLLTTHYWNSISFGRKFYPFYSLRVGKRDTSFISVEICSAIIDRIVHDLGFIFFNGCCSIGLSQNRVSDSLI